MKDPREDIAAFELVMNLYGQSAPIMAKLFVTTLAGKGQEWFTSLPRGSFRSYEQLIQKFFFHFFSKKKQKRSATYLFSIRQREEKTLKSFMGRFNNETVELMALAQKYIDEEEMNALKDSERREREQVYHRPQEARERGGMRTRNDKPREPKYQPKYHNYTPLPVTREKALMLVENVDLLKWPRHTSGCKVGRDKVGRSRSRSQDRNPGPAKMEKALADRSNAPTKGVIYAIAGGLSAGDSQRTRKRCARTLGSSKEREFVLKVEEEEAISFNSSDRPVDSEAMNDLMVIKWDIANFTVHKVLVDSGSSADIIFKSVIEKMGLENAHLELVKTPVVGFGGSEVTSLGVIELPISMVVEPKRRTLTVKFL
ncbi:uncharacterized protein LOC105179733 [Sesamum indicum]|uniref:Uncharacterized protein LOC105179733 n=1 Tax=Sesamum indicum TaxID=4182 RepID=A0A6I9UIR7_SESIN|nr:uncharacterized protein LOC105179733 [Sesamum indicum]